MFWRLLQIREDVYCVPGSILRFSTNGKATMVIYHVVAVRERIPHTEKRAKRLALQVGVEMT